MRKTLIVCALTLALAACDKGNAPAAGAAAGAAAPVASAADIAAESKRLNEWFDKKYEEQLKFSPIQLTFQGRKDLYDQVDDMSEQAQRDQVAWQKASVEEMETSFDYAKLDDETKFSYDLWKLQYENARDGLPFLQDGYAFDQMNGAQGFWPTFLISFHKVEEESDYTAYVSRLKASARAFDQFRPEGVSLLKVLDQVEQIQQIAQTAVKLALLEQMDGTVQDHVSRCQDIQPLATGQGHQVF